MYAHLKEALVKKGDKIKANQKVGLIGSTGLSTGPHLHYTIKKDNEFIDPIDYVSLPKSSYLTDSNNLEV